MRFVFRVCLWYIFGQIPVLLTLNLMILILVILNIKVTALKSKHQDNTTLRILTNSSQDLFSRYQLDKILPELTDFLTDSGKNVDLQILKRIKSIIITKYDRCNIIFVYLQGSKRELLQSLPILTLCKI